MTNGFFEIVERVDYALGHHQRGRRQHVGTFGNNAAAAFANVLDSWIHMYFSLLDVAPLAAYVSAKRLHRLLRSAARTASQWESAPQ